MDLQVRTLSKILGAEIKGSISFDNLSKDNIDFLNNCFLKYQLICIRGKPLNAVKLLKIANFFGKPHKEITRQHWESKAPEISLLDSSYKNYEEKTIRGGTEGGIKFQLIPDQFESVFRVY